MREQLDRILVALDGSEPSLRALDTALDVAAATGASLQLVSVVDVHEAELYDGLYLSREQVDALKQRVMQQILEPALARCRERKVEAKAKELVGRPLKVLLQEVDAEAPSLVVMGRTGRGAFERMLEGSVSRGMVTRAHVPVMVVP